MKNSFTINKSQNLIILHESQSVEINKVNDEVLAKLICVNQKTQKYINEVIQVLHNKIGIKNILSVILFGSQVWNNHSKSDCTDLSDCDLLIIFKDYIPDSLIKKVEKYIIALEKKHYFRETDSEFALKMINLVHQTTGMFVSHFLTKKTYFERGIFHKIFSVNKVLAVIFAPKKIVLSSVIDNSIVLWGEDQRSLIKKKIEISSTDIFKSLIMNLLIVVFSILFTPLKIFNTKYQLEAIKWSLKASNFYAFEDSKPLRIVIKRFLSIEKNFWHLKHAMRFYSMFLDLRKNPRNNIYFMIKCPFRIIKIHVKGLLFRKMVLNKRKKLELIKFINQKLNI